MIRSCRSAASCACLLFLPLRRTAKHPGVLDRYFAVSQERINRIAHFVSLHRLRAIAVVDPAFITKATVAIEDESVGVACGP